MPTLLKDPLSLRITNKLCYIGHHRFLPHDHPWRKKTDLQDVHEGKTERPESFTEIELEAELEKVRHLKPEVGPQSISKKRKPREPTRILKRRLGWWDLEYWPKLKLRHNLGVMHIEKNILDSILGTLLELEGKNKDTVNARKDLANLKIRKSLQLDPTDPDPKKSKYIWRYAHYTLAKDEKTELCQFLFDYTYPNGFCSNMSKCVNVQTRKVSGLKTHDCHKPLQRTLPSGLQGLVSGYLSSDW